jgi:hypothetical protein
MQPTPHFTIESHAAIIPALNPQWNEAISAAERRRTPRIWQLALQATAQALAGCEQRPRSVIVATALGTLDETKNFLDSVFVKGFASPRNFIASVHNSIGGRVALDFSITGPNLTLCDGPNSLASALVSVDLLPDEALPALVIAVEEHIPFLDIIHPHLSEPCTRALAKEWQDGAVALVVSRQQREGGLRIAAAGPLHIDTDPHQACRDHAQMLFGEQCTLLLPDSSSTSFFEPALALARLCDNPPPKPTVICSWSPSAGAIALVQLCS